ALEERQPEGQGGEPPHDCPVPEGRPHGAGRIGGAAYAAAMRARLPSMLAAPVLLGPGVLACFAGGYFDVPRLVAGIVAWALLAIVAIGVPRGATYGRAALVALCGLGALTDWVGASLAWAPLGGPAMDDV